MRRRSNTLKANLCQAQQSDLKTIAPLSHRPIVLTDTIDYRFLHYRFNPSCYLEADRPKFEPATFWIASECSTIKPLRPPTLTAYYWPTYT